MGSDLKSRVTEIVSGLSGSGDAERVTAEELFPVIYDELRRLARGYMSRETPGHTLQPTALVHEAYLKLVDQTRADWKGKTHFYAVGAKVMRRLLVDHARERGALKRGAGWQSVTLSEALDPLGEKPLDPERLLESWRHVGQLGALTERFFPLVTMSPAEKQPLADYLWGTIGIAVKDLDLAAGIGLESGRPMPVVEAVRDHMALVYGMAPVTSDRDE